jgi:hypothetical protein
MRMRGRSLLAFPKKPKLTLRERKGKRRAAREAEVLDVLFGQGAKVPCGCGCGALLARENMARDHTHAWELGGADGPENWRYIRKNPCHDRKTFGRGLPTTAGSDLHLIAKGKRLRGETCTGQKAKIKNRGFQTNRDGKFKASLGGGQVIRRAAQDESEVMA